MRAQTLAPSRTLEVTRAPGNQAIGHVKIPPGRVDPRGPRHILRLLCSFKLTCQLEWRS